MAKVREPRTAVVGARSTTTSKPSKTKAYTKKIVNARSTIQTKETVPAIKQRCDTTEEQSNKQPTLDRAQHARMTITSRSNREDEGLWTYSRIPLHFWNDVPIRIPQKTRAANQVDNNADQNGKVTAKQPPKQTRVGRQIHTPARFVQLVHAVIAPNDIYCRPSARVI